MTSKINFLPFCFQEDNLLEAIREASLTALLHILELYSTKCSYFCLINLLVNIILPVYIMRSILQKKEEVIYILLFLLRTNEYVALKLLSKYLFSVKRNLRKFQV